MKFTLEIETGLAEKHVVKFSCNQLLGSLSITVNNKPIHESVRLFNEPVHEVFQFMIGGREMVAVRIEKCRKQLFGHRNRVYVDNRLARVVDGF